MFYWYVTWLRLRLCRKSVTSLEQPLCFLSEFSKSGVWNRMKLGGVYANKNMGHLKNPVITRIQKPMYMQSVIKADRGVKVVLHASGFCRRTVVLNCLFLQPWSLVITKLSQLSVGGLKTKDATVGYWSGSVSLWHDLCKAEQWTGYYPMS